MSMASGYGGGQCGCGAIWFRLRATADCNEPGQVAIDAAGNITAHAGVLVCISCGKPWEAPRRQRLRALPSWDEATDAECNEILAAEPNPPDWLGQGNVIRAPFSAQQVQALNAWQTDRRVHPFTCAREHPPTQFFAGPYVGRFGQQRVLIATRDGWVCSDPGCTYTQNWAHAAMAESHA